MAKTDSIFSHRHAVEMWKHFPIDRTGYVPDEIPYSDKAIVRNLQETRASLVKSYIKAGEVLSEFMIQTLNCVAVTELDRNQCPCAPASGCYWLKTDNVIPKTCKIISVTGIVANGEMPRFQYLKWDRFQYIPKSRIASMAKGRYYTIRTIKDKEAHIYLYGDRFLEEISISAIFEDPMEAAAFPSCGEVDLQALCNPLDVDFYTDAWLRDEVMLQTWQRLLPVRSPAQTDPLNEDFHGQPLTQSQ